jgi:hypothetical protein
LTLAAPASATTADAVPGFLPADTKVIIGIQVRNLVASPLLSSVPAQVSSMGTDWMKLMDLSGFNLLRDLDEVLITTNAKGGQDAPALIVARGRFDSLPAPKAGTLYQGVRIREGKGPNGAMALLDNSTLLLGNALRIKRAIDRRASGSSFDPAMMAILSSLRSQYDIWGYGQIPPGAVPAGPQSQGLDAVERFQFGLTMRQGLELAATLHTRSGADGQKLAAAARMLEAMVKAQQPAAQGAKVDIQTEDNVVKVALSVSEEELKKAAEARNAPPRVTGSEAARTPPPPPIRRNANGDTVVVTLPGRN